MRCFHESLCVIVENFSLEQMQEKGGTEVIFVPL